MRDPPAINYRTDGVNRPLGSAYDNVPSGFLWAMLTIPVLAAIAAAGGRGLVLRFAAVPMVAGLVAFGLRRGLQRGRWKFLLGVGLFTVLAAAFVVAVVWVA